MLALVSISSCCYDSKRIANPINQKAERNAKTTIQRILVARGFRGHEVQNTEVLVSYTRGLPKGLKIALRRRQAIESWIGHMKHDGKLGRCYLKGSVGDQIHATLVAVAHNFRMILNRQIPKLYFSGD